MLPVCWAFALFDKFYSIHAVPCTLPILLCISLNFHVIINWGIPKLKLKLFQLFQWCHSYGFDVYHALKLNGTVAWIHIKNKTKLPTSNWHTHIHTHTHTHTHTHKKEASRLNLYPHTHTHTTTTTTTIPFTVCNLFSAKPRFCSYPMSCVRTCCTMDLWWSTNKWTLQPAAQGSYRANTFSRHLHIQFTLKRTLQV